MKRLFLFIVVFVLGVGAANAQDIFRQGDLVGNLGIGLGDNLYTSSYYTNKFPPMSVSMEYGVADNLIKGINGSIGVGGYFGYASATWKNRLFAGSFHETAIIIGARGTFHYQFVNRLDTYAGLMLGYHIASAKAKGDWGDYEPDSPASSAVVASLFIGARYYLTERFGVFAELGYGIAYFTLGIAYRF